MALWVEVHFKVAPKKFGHQNHVLSIWVTVLESGVFVWFLKKNYSYYMWLYVYSPVNNLDFQFLFFFQATPKILTPFFFLHLNRILQILFFGFVLAVTKFLCGASVASWWIITNNNLQIP